MWPRAAGWGPMRYGVGPGSTPIRKNMEGTHNSLSLVRCYSSDLQVPVMGAPTGAQCIT